MSSELGLLKPTIKLKRKNPQYAIWGHILAMLGGVMAILFAIVDVTNSDWLGFILGIVIGAGILIIELDYYHVELLKEANYRGVVWLIAGILSVTTNAIVMVFIVVAAIFYLVYHYE